jgi:PKD repeat protein
MAAVLAAAVIGSSCTVAETGAPALLGPSELGLSLSIQASPDTVFQDGASQSAVTIEARGPSNQPARNVLLRVDMAVAGAMMDFGTISARTVVTDDEGRARLIYTAPPPAAIAGGAGSIVTLMLAPMSGDSRGDFARQVDIRVVPRGTILPPNGVPVPDFTFSPTAPATFQTVAFDASTTLDEGVQCLANCSYTWSFGDGGSGSGQTAQHEYRAAGVFVVTLRVTDVRGQIAQVSKPVTVLAGTPLVAVLTVSPVSPRAGLPGAVFDASASSGPSPIVEYRFLFGDSTTEIVQTTPISTHAYPTPGTYVARVTVRDSAGRTASTTVNVPVIP